MEIESLKGAGAFLLVPKVYADSRGFFLESWNRKAFKDIGLDVDFVQDNHSRSPKNVLRGLHYQVNGRAQGKLVWVASGEVFDVIVDLREGSPTFGRWDGRLLTATSHERLWAPPGCAHGFLVVSTHADFYYKCSDYYSPADERSLRWDDADVGVNWPLAAGIEPLVAPKDQAATGFKDCEKYPAGEQFASASPG